MIYLCSSSLLIFLSLAINPSTLRTETGERGKNVWGAFGSVSEAQKQALQQTQQLKNIQLQTRARCFTLASDFRMRPVKFLGKPWLGERRNRLLCGQLIPFHAHMRIHAHNHTERVREKQAVLTADQHRLWRRSVTT